MQPASVRLEERLFGDPTRKLINFNFTPGDKWAELDFEQRCEAIVQMLDAPKVAGGPVRTGKPQVNIRELVKNLA